MEREEEILARSKRQSEYDVDQQEQRPNVWQEVLGIMGEGVKQMFRQVADKFKEHEEREQTEEEKEKA